MSNKPIDSDFVRNFIELCSTIESPTSFALWCGLSGVSAALGRRCWVQFGPFKFYPNLMAVIVAGSAVQRKSSAIKMVAPIIRGLQPPPNLLSDSITPEQLIRTAAGRVSDDPKKFLQKQDSTVYLIGDEVSTFINRKSYEAGIAPILIQMYNCEESVSHETVSRGKENAENTCLGLIAATTDDWLRRGLPEGAIGDGLTSRIIFVYDKSDVVDIPWPVYESRQIQIQTVLQQQLQKISEISGEFTVSPEAKEVFIEEYTRFKRDTGKHFGDESMTRGYYGRRHEHVLKVSMLVSASGGNIDRVITKPHILDAIKILERTERGLTTVMRAVATTELGDLVAEVLTKIRQRGKTTRTDLLRTLSHKLNARELQDIIWTLESAGVIETRTEGNTVVYIFKGEL